MTGERVTCTWCHRRYVGRIPRGGDGSVLFPRKHKIKRRERTSVFPTYKTIVEVCKGSFIAAEEYMRENK